MPATTTALIAQVPRIALEELARRMLENPGSVSRADFEAALAGHDEGESTVAQLFYLLSLPWKARVTSYA